ncbi:MAG: GntR family transcriptional regulator [Rhodospirillales bacterium]|nr:GntR family transcriptional regulator [Rhodospirillales bacterium]
MAGRVTGATGGKRPKESRTEAVYREIRRRILENEYSPGHNALELDLANEFGVSRTPLREALIRLENEGLVEIIPRHGMRVLPMSAEDMLEIYQIMTVLETLAVGIIADRGLRPADVTALEAATDDMAKALAADDLDAWAEADDRFHQIMLDLTKSRRLVSTVNGFWDQTHRAQRLTLRLREKPVRSTENHRRLIEAFKKGDAELARSIHSTQRQKSHEELIDILERYAIRHL